MESQTIEVRPTGGMTREQKEHFVLNYYHGLDHKKPYCMGVAEMLEEEGFGPVNWHSLQSNVFSRGILPKEEIKINLIYEYTINYQSDIDGKAKEEAEPCKVVPEAQREQ